MVPAPLDPDDLREQILLRLRVEQEVRDQLALQQEQAGPPAPPPPWSWLDSKLGLLLLGALITGVLVPSFQFTQESLSWTRQNRYDELKLQRAGIHESLRQFLAAHAQSSELNEIGLAALESADPGSVGARGDFYGGKPYQVDPRRFWWAIPSVFRDPAYPYRVMVLSSRWPPSEVVGRHRTSIDSGNVNAEPDGACPEKPDQPRLRCLWSHPLIAGEQEPKQRRATDPAAHRV